MKYVEIDKRSKKERKAFYTSKRVVNGFNTGTRSMKSAKYPNRQVRKKIPKDY